MPRRRLPPPEPHAACCHIRRRSSPSSSCRTGSRREPARRSSRPNCSSWRRGSARSRHRIINFVKSSSRRLARGGCVAAHLGQACRVLGREYAALVAIVSTGATLVNARSGVRQRIRHGGCCGLAIGDQNGARHDFRHPFRKLENVVPDPVGRDLVGGKRFIRAIEHPDADEHIRPAIEQKNIPEILAACATAAQSSPARGARPRRQRRVSARIFG